MGVEDKSHTHNPENKIQTIQSRTKLHFILMHTVVLIYIKVLIHDSYLTRTIKFVNL